MCAPCVTPCCVRCCILGAMTTQLGLQAQVTLFTQKLPKGGEPPMWWTRLSLWQTWGGLMREWLVKVRSLKLRYQFFSFHHPRLDQTGSACLSPVFCLTLDTQVYPILPLDAFWLNHFESIFTVLSLSFYFLLCIYTVVYKSPCLIVQVSSQADSGLGQQYLLHTGSSKPGIFLRVL